MRRTPGRRIAAACLLAVLVVTARLVVIARAQQAAGADFDVVQVRPNFYMIAGAGANIAVQVGPIGAIVVDTGRRQVSERVVAAVKRLTDGPIRYIIDTSADADHTGGNDTLAKAGKTILGNTGSAGFSEDVYTNGGAASVLAHENVLRRMSASTGGEPSVRSALWPTKTYAGNGYPMYLNGDAIQVIHMPAAHSDGDSVVFFHRADVIVAGDILDTTRFPVIDVTNGGSLKGEIDALNRIVEMTVPPFPLAFQEDRTYVVPGHGFLCDFYDLVEYRSVVLVMRDRIQDLISRGMTLQQVQAADPAKGFRKRYGAETGPWTTDMFVEAVFKSLTASTPGK
jgi:glyoxylase-like metal-dependent hydrolase (beta-lactamase superfamily II)